MLFKKYLFFFFCKERENLCCIPLWFLWAFLLFSGKIFVIFIIVTLQGGGIRKRNALPLEWSCLVAAESYLHILLKCISSWLWLIQQTLLNWHPQSPATGKTKKKCTLPVILLPLCPTSLTHKNPKDANNSWHGSCGMQRSIYWLIWRCFFYRVSCLCDFCGCSCGCC